MDEKDLHKKLGIEDRGHTSGEVMKQLLAFWPSLGPWYKRKCDFTGETILTNLSDKARFPVYKYEVFISDQRTPIEATYDPNQSFFAQLKKLQEANPRPHQIGENNENCFYCDDVWGCKSCYLSTSMLECENLFYSYRNLKGVDSIDLVFCFDVEKSISVTYGEKCYKTYYSLHVTNCRNSYFLYDCVNCSNCFMCWNLRNKEFCIRNEQYSKEEYKKKLEEYTLSSRTSIDILQQEFEQHVKDDALHKAVDNLNCEGVTGTYNINCKNSEELFFVQESQDCKNVFRAYQDSDCMDCGGLMDSQLCYMCSGVSYGHKLKFSAYSIRCQNSAYLDNCHSCNNCFGCVSLKRKEFCILNKQYTKEEYEKLLPQIIEKMRAPSSAGEADSEWGKFLPYDMAYTGYNATLANIYYADTKENIMKLGGYRDEEHINSDAETQDIPDDINDVPETFSSVVVRCTKTNKSFNFAKQVITLYKEANLPLPNIFHTERIIEKFKPLIFNERYETTCYITGKKIVHYYPPSLGYKKIVSGVAYEKEIYG